MFYPLPLFIGLRYVRSRSRGYFVSFMSWTSMLGICVGVAAKLGRARRLLAGRDARPSTCRWQRW